MCAKWKLNEKVYRFAWCYGEWLSSVMWINVWTLIWHWILVTIYLHLWEKKSNSWTNTETNAHVYNARQRCRKTQLIRPNMEAIKKRSIYYRHEQKSSHFWIMIYLSCSVVKTFIVLWTVRLWLSGCWKIVRSLKIWLGRVLVSIFLSLVLLLCFFLLLFWIHW